MFKKEKELKQRIVELEKTCIDLESAIDYKDTIISKVIDKEKENEYRIKLLEDEKTKLNNVISNLMEERNKLTAKKIRSAKSTKPNTSNN